MKNIFSFQDLISGSGTFLYQKKIIKRGYEEGIAFTQEGSKYIEPVSDKNFQTLIERLEVL